MLSGKLMDELRSASGGQDVLLDAPKDKFEAFLIKHAPLGFLFKAILNNMAREYSEDYKSGSWIAIDDDICTNSQTPFFRIEIKDAKEMYRVKNRSNNFDAVMPSRLFAYCMFTHALNHFSFHLYEDVSVEKDLKEVADEFFAFYEYLYENVDCFIEDANERHLFYKFLD